MNLKGYTDYEHCMSPWRWTNWCREPNFFKIIYFRFFSTNLRSGFIVHHWPNTNVDLISNCSFLYLTFCKGSSSGRNSHGPYILLPCSTSNKTQLEIQHTMKNLDAWTQQKHRKGVQRRRSTAIFLMGITMHSKAFFPKYCVLYKVLQQMWRNFFLWVNRRDTPCTIDTISLMTLQLGY